jgi:very-short-patch-repair endonuclease
VNIHPHPARPAASPPSPVKGEGPSAAPPVRKPIRKAEDRGTRPSPLAGEGGARSAPGEGAKTPKQRKRPRAVSPAVSRARVLRKRSTDAEERLWAMLRQPPFRDAKFRRQVPIGRFIVDFASYPARLVIEVDGGQHAESISDQRRDRWLAGQGFSIRRYWNTDVLTNAEGVGADIVAALGRAWPDEEVKQ